LNTAVTKIAVGVLMMRAWPEKSGHNAALAVGGFLARCKWTPDEIEEIVGLVARSDKYRGDNKRSARESAENYAKGAHTFGFPGLCENLGDEAAKLIAKILDYGAETEDGFKAINGVPTPSQENIRLALEKLGVIVKYNSFSGRVHVEGLDGYPLLDDRAMEHLWLTIEERFKFRPGWDYFWKVVFNQAHRNKFHPVCEYLDKVQPQWNQTKRIDTWLIDYAGAPDTPYVRAVGPIFLVAAVRRVRQPGCKFDEMPIFQAMQGENKSTALQILAVNKEWFSDELPLNADSKKVVESLQGHWIVEASELKGMKKADVEHLKSFLSRTVDKARLSYDRARSDWPRQCVLAGTTNDTHPLPRDMTGNRRYWPVSGVKFDLEKLRRDRDQLWAEAAKRESEGFSIRLAEGLWDTAAQIQADHTVDDPWVDVIRDELGDRKGKLICSDAWALVGMTIDRATHELNHRLGTAMQAAGWIRKQRRFGKLGRRWCYIPADSEKQVELPQIKTVLGDRRFGGGVTVTVLDEDEDENKDESF
jgi:hypothetical protein